MRWRAALIALALGGSGAAAQTAPVAPPPVDLPGLNGGDAPSGTVSADVAATSALLVVDQDALFQRSQWGLRVQAEVAAEAERIQAENERLAQQLADEEAALTAARAGMDAAEFRRRAEAFDLRATEVRRERAEAVATLNAQAEADRTAFYQAALPVMGALMSERGAVAVLDRRTVFISVEEIDITQALIARLDDSLGDGRQ